VIVVGAELTRGARPLEATRGDEAHDPRQQEHAADRERDVQHDGLARTGSA
jgi:hypothetical protein